MVLGASDDIPNVRPSGVLQDPTGAALAVSKLSPKQQV
jgi:hypothetical protein